MAKSPSSSSPSPRRTTTRKPRKKAETVTDELLVAADEVATSSAVDDELEFGAGVMEDDVQAPPPPKKPRPKRTAAKPRKPIEVIEAELPELQEEIRDVDFEDDEELPVSRHQDFDDDDDEEPAPSGEMRPVGEGDRGEDSSGEDRGAPRRRRRRRRRRGGEGKPTQNPPQQSGHQQRPSHDSQRQQRSSQNRGQQHQNKSPRPAGRGKIMSKFDQNAAPAGPAQTSGTIEGVLELHPKGYGFLRSASNDYGARETDPFVSSSFVEKHGLREGIRIVGDLGPGTRGQGPRLLSILSIDGGTPEEYEKLKHFDTLTPINPFEQIKLETLHGPLTMRVMDLLCPIGKGQRALIVAPPRTGKTMLLQDIANAVSVNHPEVHLIVLLIDERPEEVTEMRRTVKGEVIASSMDQDVESHVRISQLIFERGKRLAEAGKDCFILMDSITRTARAFNKWIRGGRDSKIQTGGLDVRAMDIPRKMFGTARRFDEGGSLTVCATALIDTGSRMDEAIFQEFKGTGNMEMVLSRDLADRRIWPSIDISKSGTRREEKILERDLQEGITMLRRSLVSLNSVEAMDQLTRTLAKFETNREFLQKIKAVL